ncbi:hypothetical protein [Pseudoalteromonas undina]|uniref:hypothetical protein n=1 Tax=Pseudoalteromonas undina TaxID=43660 RepID=UPI001D01939F|nr:hypothetical protein [Pseudoalteromonas undina]
MAAFKKLIFIQLMAWLILVTAGCYFISQNFDSAIGKAQKNAQATVEQYIKNLSATDLSADNLKNTLASSEIFSHFTLRDYQGAEVFSVNNAPQLPFIAELIQSSNNSVRPQYATNHG